MTLTVDTAIMMEAILVLSMIAIILIGRLMWQSGGEFVPETMKVMYRATLDWFMRTGSKSKPSDDYPNRKEDS